MALKKRKRIEQVIINYSTLDVKVKGAVEIYDDETNVVEATKNKDIKIRKNDDAKAMELGIKALTDFLWYKNG